MPFNWGTNISNRFTCSMITMPFSSMQTVKFKTQTRNVFFTTINQMFHGCSQFPATAKHCFLVWTAFKDFITMHSAVVRSWEELLNICLMIAKNVFVSQALNFRVCMLLKGTVRTWDLTLYEVAVIELNLRLPRANEVSDIVEGSYLILLNYRNGGLCTWPWRKK